METLAIDRRFGWIGMFFFFFFNEHLKYQISIENYLDNEIFNLSLSSNREISSKKIFHLENERG